MLIHIPWCVAPSELQPWALRQTSFEGVGSHKFVTFDPVKDLPGHGACGCTCSWIDQCGMIPKLPALQVVSCSVFESWWVPVESRVLRLSCQKCHRVQTSSRQSDTPKTPFVLTMLCPNMARSPLWPADQMRFCRCDMLPLQWCRSISQRYMNKYSILYGTVYKIRSIWEFERPRKHQFSCGRFISHPQTQTVRVGPSLPSRLQK